jgi:hypothetical protein
MLSCWQTDPDDRPTFPELKETLMKLEEVQSRVSNIIPIQSSLINKKVV